MYEPSTRFRRSSPGRSSASGPTRRVPVFDAAFFDSGGTLYQEDPARSRAAGEPTIADARATGPGRAASALMSAGIEVGAEPLASAIDSVEAAARRREGAAFSYITLVTAGLAELGIAPPREIVVFAADAFAGPRYPSWVYPGTHAMLDRMDGAGIDLGIIANTDWPGFSMDRAYEGLGLLRYFRTRVYSCDAGVKKPDRRIFEIAAERARLTDQRVLFVGNDQTTDGVGARSFGWSVALRRGPEAEGFAADFLFDGWDELLDFVGVS